MSKRPNLIEPGKLTLCGVPGSPYTRKMLALLRYRQIPYKLVLGSNGSPGLPMAKPPMLPTFYYPGADGAATPVTERVNGLVIKPRTPPPFDNWPSDKVRTGVPGSVSVMPSRTPCPLPSAR